MSVNASLYVGMSGMKVNEHQINVVGNNLANMNTIGFKASRGTFSDLLSQTLVGSSGAYQVGLGSGVTGSQRLTTQGALLGTGVSTDVAIGGRGFFVVKPANGEATGSADGMFYTRNGQFMVDEEGYLSTLDNYRIQGYMGLPDGTVSNRLGDLKLGGTTSPPQATTSLTMHVNLDANTEVVDQGPTGYSGTLDPNNPDEFAEFSTTMQVYDSLGKSHQIEIFFVKTDEGQWDWHAMAPAGDITPGTDGFQLVASGSMSFNGDGQLQNVTKGPLPPVQFSGADAQDLTFDFGDPIDDGGDGSGSTGFGSASSVEFLEQDGYPAGNFQYMNIKENGTIEGTFSNGQVLALGQVALADFENPVDLQSVGSNMFASTPGSGDPRIGRAEAGGRGSVYGGALEQSNVDLANEFTAMIIAQRGYQAASRTIATADQMLQEAVNLKR
jgi:flagellar hook protein FlgE